MQETSIHDQAIYAKLTDTLFEYPFFRTIGVVFMIVSITYLCWGQSHYKGLVLWASSGSLVVVLRTIVELIRVYKRSLLTTKQWSRTAAVVAILTGCFLGSAAWLVHQIESDTIKLGVALLLGGYIIVAMSELYPKPSAFYWLAITVTMPYVTVFFIQNTLVGRIAIIGLLVNLFLVLFFINKYHLYGVYKAKKALREEQQRIDAIEANLSKSRFLAAASHDLRQPLHALLLFIDILENKTSDPSSLKTINSLKTTASTLELMFNTLLDISKLDADMMQPHMVHFRLNSVTDKLSHEYDKIADNHNLAWNVGHCNQVVYSDPVLLETILRNLISNAIRFTQQGHIKIIGRQTDGNVQLSIEDSGVGIPENLKEKIFEEFYQVENSGYSRTKGFGLGLSIVNRLCRLLNIPLTLDSTVNQGSVFTLKLPEGDESKIKTVKPKDKLPTIDTQFTDVLIIIVEDDSSIRRSMKALLEQWGCNVVAGKNTQQILEQLPADKHVDLIISDYWLGEQKTGLDAITELVDTLAYTIPALILTGDAAIMNQKLQTEMGITVFLKPVQPARLRVFIRNTLGKPSRIYD